MDDQHLAVRAAQGDQEAFTLLVKRYRSYIYRLAYKIALREEDALDITQNVLFRLVKKIGSYDGKGPFQGWLRTITVRIAIDHLRGRKKQELPMDFQVVDQIDRIQTGNLPDNPRKILIDARQRSELEIAMASLSPQQRSIFLLYLGEEMRPKDISQVLEIPARQVRLQIHRGIEKIRKLLKPVLGEENQCLIRER